MTTKESGRKPAYVLVLTWPVTTTGGVNEVVFAFAEQLRNFGWRPIVAVATWSNAAQPPEWRGVEVVNLRLRDPSACRTAKSLAAFAITSLRDAAALRAFVRRENVAVIDFHFPSLAAFVPAVLWMYKQLGARLVLSFHGNDFVDMAKARGWVRSAWRFVLRHCDAITAVSGSLRDSVAGWLPGIRVTTVHNGVDHELFSVRRTVGRVRPLLLQIAKFEHKKAQDVLLKALRSLLDEGIDVDLLLVGSSGPQLEKTRALVRELQLENRVRMEVDLPHDRIPAIMANADLFVLPSRLEPFGIVLLEAGVVGLPVIATRVGGIPELLVDGETGLLVKPDATDELAHAIRRLLKDPELADRLAAAWHAQVMAHWTWEECARERLAVTT